ncbi:MAG: hypothetical protein ACM33C_00705 [Syntrophaceae bacterium]
MKQDCNRNRNGRPDLLGLIAAIALSGALLALAGCGQPLFNPGLRAVYPQQRMILFVDPPPGAFVPVDSLQPTLKWESFPRSRDLAGSMAHVYRRIGDVRYELVLAEVGSPDRIYRPDGLKEASHKVETQLKSRTKYLWTVRACFRIGEEPRCTEWGAISDWEQSAVWHPNFSASYRFETP